MASTAIAAPHVDDPDAETESVSRLWSRALEPNGADYADLLLHARRRIDARTPAELTEALAMADRAIALRPNTIDGYLVAGNAAERRGLWSDCVDRFTRAEHVRVPASPAHPIDDSLVIQRGLGVCLARTGKLDAAAGALTRQVSAGRADDEDWLRLGEVHLTQGRLDEAIHDFNRALALERTADTITVRWLIALAADRAGRITEARDAARLAAQLDDKLGRLGNPFYAYIEPGTLDYLYGLGYEATNEPERAMIHWRNFIATGPAQWQPRATEHVDLINKAGLHSPVRRHGTAPITDSAAEITVGKMRFVAERCLAALPRVAMDVLVIRTSNGNPAPSKHGQKKPWLEATTLEPGKMPAGVLVGKIDALDGDSAAVDAAKACIERGVEAVPTAALPQGDWATYGFVAVAR